MYHYYYYYMYHYYYYYYYYYYMYHYYYYFLIPKRKAVHWGSGSMPLNPSRPRLNGKFIS